MPSVLRIKSCGRRLIPFDAFLMCRQRESIHLARSESAVFGVKSTTRVLELRHIPFRAGPRALVINDPIHALRRCLVIEPDFAALKS